MLWRFIVMWLLLLLKILLIKIKHSNSYEFGYHPSAEEFDQLLRETQKTWTHDLIAREREQRHTDTIQIDTHNYMPKYNYERERKRQKDKMSPSEYAEKWDKPMTMTHSEENWGAGNIPHPIGSTLNFTLFSDETQVEFANDPTTTIAPLPLELPPPRPFHSIQGNVFSGSKPVYTHQNIVTNIPSDIIEIQSIAGGSQKIPSSDDLHKNNSQPQFPIYFTNPATGIVYAITEVGKVQQTPNDTIAIYVTKAQYDRDMNLLKKYYEDRCSDQSFIGATSKNTTAQPQIIRLKRPNGAGIISKLPNSVAFKPPPVIVQTEVTVADNDMSIPPKRTPSKKNKKKKKKKTTQKRRPGRKPTSASTLQNFIPDPISGGSIDRFAPQIVLGKRTSAIESSTTTSANKLATQLEKPNTPTTTIYSDLPIAATSGYMSPISKTVIVNNEHRIYSNHRLEKRSTTTNIRNIMEQTIFPNMNSTSNNINDQQQPAWRSIADPIQSKNIIIDFNATNSVYHPPRIPPTKRRLPERINRAMLFRDRLHGKRNSTTTRRSRAQNINSTEIVNLEQEQSNQRNIENGTKSKNVNKKTTKVKHKKHKDGSDFDLLDFIETLDDDEDNIDVEDDDDYYYDYEVEKDKSQTHKNGSSEADNTNLKEDIVAGNSSSAEEGADFGALEMENQENRTQNMHSYDESDDDDVANQSSNTKNSAGKKRIRRRPAITDSSTSSASVSSISYEDYNDRDGVGGDDDDGDDDDDDDGGVNGIGGFFRMIFYPVQVMMNNIYDGFIDRDDTEKHKPNYPTYTQYNNVLKGDHHISSNYKDDDDDDDDVGDDESEQQESNSLTNWFSSLFGLNRQTKKIGSTTVAPPFKPVVVASPSSKESSWWEYMFGSNSKETSTSNEDYDYDAYDKWYNSWFDTKSKAKRRKSTSTTTSTTQQPTMPQVPILTIVDPLKNPQNWIGILAHHIANTTSPTLVSRNPIMEALTRATLPTTTENPEMSKKVSYNKHQIWRLKVQDDSEVKALQQYKKSEEGVKLQWLKGPSLRGLTDVLVPPKMFNDFQATLNAESIAYEVLIFDVGKVIAYEQTKGQYFHTTTNTATPTKQHINSNKKNKKKKPSRSSITMSWDKYYNYDDILIYLESIRVRQPKIIELMHIGRSYEGRPLVVVKIQSKEKASLSAATPAIYQKLKNKKKPTQANAVFIEAGIHGHEWIGPATATWFINELLRIMKSNKTTAYTEYIRNTTWYIMPVLNPDGYAYSHEYDRFWKKSRSRHISHPNSDIISSAMTWLQQKKPTERVCFGVDLDRNWRYQWGKRGGSKAPCNEFYMGPVPFSEPETKALSEFLMDHRKQIKLFISMQAYGQILSYPIKTNASPNSERIDDLFDVAMVGMDGLRKKGDKSRYKIDSTNDLTENRSGCSDAFAAYEVGLPFSYTLQLADNGVHGYLLPSSSIATTARDAFHIVTSMVDYI